jgi:hypothetical protein
MAKFSPFLLSTVRNLIEDEGSVKVASLIQATPLPDHVLTLTHQYLSWCGIFHSPGSEGGVSTNSNSRD